ncbi:hypothetical protein Bca4012_012022 [Brassica carinata]
MRESLSLLETSSFDTLLSFDTLETKNHQMDSSSTPNRDDRENDKDVEGDEVQELVTPDSKGKRKVSSEGSEETYKAKKSPRILPTRSKI